MTSGASIQPGGSARVSDFPVPGLRVLVVSTRAEDGPFIDRVLSERGDLVLTTVGAAEAMKVLAEDAFDVCIVQLALPEGDGLALVHHIRASKPDTDILVLSAADDLTTGAHAMALGVVGTIMYPLTGDSLLVAVERTRERRAMLAQRERARQTAEEERARAATFARCAAFVSETEFAQVAERVLQACVGELPVSAGAIYTPAPIGSRLLRSALVGRGDELPDFLQQESLADLDPTTPVHEDIGLLRILFLGPSDVLACAILVPTADVTERTREGLTMIASLGTAAFVAAEKASQVASSGIKDPQTSAYTFAYFGDVAGREIDRAARHGRKFALLTLHLTGLNEFRQRAPMEVQVDLQRALTDAILDAVRDSDVLARVEDEELFLLMPETGLLGAYAARRRILAGFDGIEELPALLAKGGVPHAELSLYGGIGVYPQDGRDLGTLLRTARRRADASEDGPWRRLGLEKLDFWSALELLLGAGDLEFDEEGLELTETQEDAAATLARHAVLPRALLPSITDQILHDAEALGTAGVLYAAGDAEVCRRVARNSGAAGPPSSAPKFRAWSLGSEDSAPGTRYLPVDDRMLGDRTLVLTISELGGYVMVARPLPEDTAGFPVMLAYHATDFDVVEGLVTSFQRAFHLQPEVG